MLDHQWLGVVQHGAESGQILARPDVPKRHANVAQETTSLDALDRRTAKEFPKARFIKSEELA